MFDKNIYALDDMKEEGDIIPVFSIGDDELKFDDDYKDIMPVLALKNTVLFPGVVIPITVGRDKSIKALQKADKGDKFLGVITQTSIDSEDPTPDGLHRVGTIARIMKILKMPDGSTTAILQGRKRFVAKSFIHNEKMLEAEVEVLDDHIPARNMEFNAMISSIRDYAKKIIELSPNIPTEATMMLNNIKNNGFLLNFISSNINLAVDKKQEILAIDDYVEKAGLIMAAMNNELQLLQIKDKIESRVRGDLEKQQKEYFLNQQLKTIQEELGGNPQEEELNKLQLKADKKKWPTEAKEAFNRDIVKARRINPQIAEYSVILNYLELMLDLPWNDVTKDVFNLKKVKSVLDKDHFGLEDVKNRIIEHLAVLKLKGDMKAPIICLVGPPGVGKTSLGKSVATALGRQFIRMSLGGLHDESEIRGHRKTYIGAMPGRIIQSIKKAKSSNPVFILDEIDKLGKDFRGDPSSALLEVLDPEQNSTFHDNYLDVDYDLSRVLFIATANSLSTVQPALLDRMEIIEISGYSLEEKVEISKRHLVPKQLKEHGLKDDAAVLTPQILQYVIQKFTRESGVRSLDRSIAGVMRSVAKKVAMNEKYNPKLSEKEVGQALGPIKFDNEQYTKIDLPGVAVGLAWTRTGGDILFIEASISKGKGKLVLTGNLGDVMKESASTALSYIKAHCTSLGIEAEIFENTDIHIHVPEGAIPKDGPSAGITMLTALTSALKGKPVKSHLAMTGEITLRGKVLPVGGIKEKVLAARRAGITKIMLCEENRRHVELIPADYVKGVEFIYVTKMDQVIENALGFLVF
ncbi:MAG: endopeptidase La [Saprospiraceae bacterium]|jgi:ATP-dependent Lon protease|nr:endopeptidase La [Saprospiraceae bacterium]